uniref:UDP-N-acetylglucosamine--peptide N-acetylglucosaminyltransferase SPINDLY n=1 Tax=Amphora coffeiformis TaxID=265554 RepID=A0A7S3KXQ0_9STRA|eukprot:scaffold12782_cov168-Amphora_coffeaeformis.AAC.2
MGAPHTQEKPADQELKKPADEGLPPSTLQTYLNLVQQYLGVFMIDNAKWLAERCVADYPSSSEAVYLLALCHYRTGSPRAARQILELSNAPSSLSMEYLIAVCSYEMEEYDRAEDVLLRGCRNVYRQSRTDTSVATLDEWILSTSPCPVPNGAAGLALLGKVCRETHRTQRAIVYFRMSLQLDPFLWTSVAALAELGVKYDPSEFFGVRADSPENQQQHQQQTHPNIAAGNSVLQAKTPLQPSTTMETPAPPASALPSRRSVRFETPNLTPIPVNASMAETPPKSGMSTIDYHPPVPVRRAAQVASRQYYPPSPETPLTSVTRSMRYLRGLGGATDEATPGGGRHLFLSSENKASNAAAQPRPEEPEKPLAEKTLPANAKVHEILEVLSVASTAYQHLCNYRCPDALRVLDSMSPKQQETGWALHQKGKAYLEMNEFTSAQRCLEAMQSIDPSRVKGLELLSTVYWQLKKEMELANLAHIVVENFRNTPEAWCVVGNCFSLQKDHETSLVFFKRSLQLDPHFAYTHTLAGYEYMANEDFDKAIKCFREALRVDDRRYNAWYGLGAIFHRQEKFNMAEYHFEKAVSLHPSSSVLRCNLGMAQYANGNTSSALDTLAEANRLDPRNPQARFQRATIFTSINRPADALAELERVRDAAPREATVHFAMGKVLKRLGRPQEAMKCFLTAMDLDPKDNQLIKSAMDKLDEPDVDEEHMTVF